MRKRSALLLATGDPMMDADLGQATGVSIIPSACETAADCLEQVRQHSPGAVLLSQALVPAEGDLVSLVREVRGSAPQVEVLVLARPDQVTEGELTALQKAGVVLLPASDPARSVLEAWVRGGALPPFVRPAPMVNPPPSPIGYLQTSQMQKALPERAPATQAVPGPPVTYEPEVPDAVPQSARQKIVAFWGGKPGAGRSTLLTAVADLISRNSSLRVCTVDLNAANSSLAALLHKDGEQSSWSVLGDCLMTGPLSAQAVSRAVLPVNARWSLISGPGGSDQWCGLLTVEAVIDLLGLLRAEFDTVLVDLPAGRSAVADTALALADQVIIVVSAFFPDVMDSARNFDRTLAEGVLSRQKCSLVLGQWADSGEMPAGDISSLFQLPILAQVPLVPHAALAAARNGVPVSQLNTADAKALGEAATVIGELICETSLGRAQKRGWFGR